MNQQIREGGGGGGQRQRARDNLRRDRQRNPRIGESLSATGEKMDFIVPILLYSRVFEVLMLKLGLLLFSLKAIGPNEEGLQYIKPPIHKRSPKSKLCGFPFFFFGWQK